MYKFMVFKPGENTLFCGGHENFVDMIECLMSVLYQTDLIDHIENGAVVMLCGPNTDHGTVMFKDISEMTTETRQ